MPNRTSNSPDYRYGFNGKEKDESGEWGDLMHYDYGFRIYNPGIARFLSVDPLTQGYPMLTPYQFASNSPIGGVDVDGLEFLDSETSMIDMYSGKTFLKLDNASNPTKNRVANSTTFTYVDESGATSTGTDFDITINDGYGYFLNNIDIQRNGFGGPIKSSETRNGINRDYVKRRGNGGNSHEGRKYERSLVRKGYYPGQKGIPVGPRMSPKGGGKGIIPAIVGIINSALNWKANDMVLADFALAEAQSNKYGELSVRIVEKAIEGGIVPVEYQTDDIKADLANYVLQGSFLGTYEEDTQDKLERVGIMIILSDERVNMNFENNFENNTDKGTDYDRVSPIPDVESTNDKDE